jgi:PilZ domain
MMVRERRKNFRVQWNSPATIELDNGRTRTCIVSDLSNGGARISGVKSATIPDQFMLQVFFGGRPARRCRVIWRSANELGVAFADRRGDTESAKARREMAPA